MNLAGVSWVPSFGSQTNLRRCGDVTIMRDALTDDRSVPGVFARGSVPEGLNH